MVRPGIDPTLARGRRDIRHRVCARARVRVRVCVGRPRRLCSASPLSCPIYYVRCYYYKGFVFYSAVCIILYLPVTLIMVDEFLYDIIIVFGVKPVFFLNSSPSYSYRVSICIHPQKASFIV